jgi:uncharacterized protein with HEPN domain
MRRPDDSLFVDMLVYARRVASRVARTSRPEFDQNEDLQLALTYLIQVISEAASRLTREQRDAYPNIPWRDIIGMRHIVVHDYFRLDLDVIWRTANENIPPLVNALELVVQEDDR